MHTWDWVAPEVDNVRVNRSFSNVKLTKMERSALDMVNQMTWQEAERLVVPHNEQEVLVAAFGDDKVGSFAIRLQRNCMLDCTCMNGAVPNSRGRKKTCRHMFLVNRVLNKSFEWEQHVKRRLLAINQVILGSEPRKRFHDAYDIPWEKAQLLIAGNHKDKIQVHSFTDYSKIYDIALEDEVMVSCSCPDDMSICKHMYVGQRVMNKLVTYERSFQNERHLTLKDILRMKEDKELDKKREAFQVWQQEAESLVELVRQRWGAANEASSSESGETSATPQDKEKPEQDNEEEQPSAKKRKLSHSEADGEDASPVNGDKKAAEKRAALESFRQQAEMLGNLARGQKIDDIVQTWGLQQINAIIGDLRKMKQMLGAL